MSIGDGEEAQNNTSDWLESINQGGLITVSDTALILNYFLARRENSTIHVKCISDEAVNHCEQW